MRARVQKRLPVPGPLMARSSNMICTELEGGQACNPFHAPAELAQLAVGNTLIFRPMGPVPRATRPEVVSAKALLAGAYIRMVSGLPPKNAEAPALASGSRPR